jgi:NAD(P)-dependent dehydrogenase (short-subunit alcohol dehydrogenase family)
MMAKFGMTLSALGIAEEMRDAGIASNTLWPRTLVATAAVRGGNGACESLCVGAAEDLLGDHDGGEIRYCRGDPGMIDASTTRRLASPRIAERVDHRPGVIGAPIGAVEVGWP